jgi:hypothetical protein
METNNQNSGNGNQSEERSNRHQTEQEGSGVAAEREQQQQRSDGSNTSYSEKADVTPPNKKDFPTTGPSKADFESRPQGRTTGRMLGHEPGTESL